MPATTLRAVCPHALYPVPSSPHCHSTKPFFNLLRLIFFPSSDFDLLLPIACRDLSIALRHCYDWLPPRPGILPARNTATMRALSSQRGGGGGSLPANALLAFHPFTQRWPALHDLAAWPTCDPTPGSAGAPPARGRWPAPPGWRALPSALLKPPGAPVWADCSRQGPRSSALRAPAPARSRASVWGARLPAAGGRQIACKGPGAPLGAGQSNRRALPQMRVPGQQAGHAASWPAPPPRLALFSHPLKPALVPPSPGSYLAWQ